MSAPNKQIGKLRKRMCKELDLEKPMFADLSPVLEGKLAQAADYADFRRIENERQLESIKALMAGYMFNDNVVVQGTIEKNDGSVKVVQVSHFDIMLRATTMFLAAMNMQNKMWGLNTVPAAPKGDGAQPINLKNLSVTMVQEVQRMAKRGDLLPPAKAKIIENGR